MIDDWCIIDIHTTIPSTPKQKRTRLRLEQLHPVGLHLLLHRRRRRLQLVCFRLQACGRLLLRTHRGLQRADRLLRPRVGGEDVIFWCYSYV